MKTRNKFETRILNQLKHTGIDFGYEVENIPYTIKGFYKSDFTILCKNGKKIIVETKGYFRPEDKRKMVAVKKQHPDLDIRILFYAANKSYIRWAIKYGFPFAVREIPLEWLEEFKSNGP
jgi:restriction endonuclease